MVQENHVAFPQCLISSGHLQLVMFQKELKFHQNMELTGIKSNKIKTQKLLRQLCYQKEPLT